MECRTLGRTGLQVSRLGMGGLFVSRAGGEGRKRAYDAIHRSRALGVNYIDTAPGYLDSEEVIGEALEGMQQPLIVSTKFGGRPLPFDPQSLDQLKLSFQESLRLLGRDSVDILMIHEPDRPGQYDWWTDCESFTGPVTEYLAELRAEGLVRFTGLGGTTPYILARICATGQFDVVLTAFNYSLLWREAAEAVIPAAKKKGMGIVSGSPLQQGWFSRRYDETVRDHPPPWLSPVRREQFLRLYALLDEVNMPVAEMALRFVLSNKDFDTVLMGARSVEEVELNVAAAEKGPLPRDLLAKLDEIGAMAPFRPCEEPAGCGFGWDRRGPGGMR